MLKKYPGRITGPASSNPMLNAPIAFCEVYIAAEVEAWLEARLKIYTFIGQRDVSGHDVIRALLADLRGEGG